MVIACPLPTESVLAIQRNHLSYSYKMLMIGRSAAPGAARFITGALDYPSFHTAREYRPTESHPDYIELRLRSP